MAKHRKNKRPPIKAFDIQCDVPFNSDTKRLFIKLCPKTNIILNTFSDTENIDFSTVINKLIGVSIEDLSKENTCWNDWELSTIRPVVLNTIENTDLSIKTD